LHHHDVWLPATFVVEELWMERNIHRFEYGQRPQSTENLFELLHRARAARHSPVRDESN
jgi:hypothetical protein